jgi:shikimate dehydrogenase
MIGSPRLQESDSVSRVLRLGVIGDPVAHSISPAMQQPALDALRVNAIYERWQTSASELPARINSLRQPGMLGANVTVPHKQAVMALLDDVTPLAQRVGAVNTIVNKDGRLSGDNTDVYGFTTALLEVCPDAANRRVVLLGAGGAARGVALALSQIGVLSITIANRNAGRAQVLCDELGLANLQPTALADAPFAGADVLINATSLGWHAGESPINPRDLASLPPRALVVDLTYRDTDLLDAARARGLATLDGLGMLVHQGALAFERFTGQPAPLDVMWNAARLARAPRL